MNLKKWIVAARLRTLPLSLSAVFLGVTIGINDIVSTTPLSNIYILTFLILFTAVCLQILSNFANDYGDNISGVDASNRVGPKRSLQLGEMTVREIKIAIIFISLLCIISGILMIYFAFLSSETLSFDYIMQNSKSISYFILLGGLSIIAAITYTVGLTYGYKGLGDISVFVFFGLVAVLGSEFLLSKELSIIGITLGVNAGFMAVAVLNVNNLRDYESDRINGKKSLVVIFGENFGKLYHLLLAIMSITIQIIFITYFALNDSWNNKIINVIFIIFLSFSCFCFAKCCYFCVNKNNKGAILDPMLKKTSLSSAFVNIVQAFIFLF